MSISLFDLTGKRALITGATHGLGMAMAMGLAKAGAEIIVNGQKQESLDTAIAEYDANGNPTKIYTYQSELYSYAYDQFDPWSNPSNLSRYLGLVCSPCPRIRWDQLCFSL